jgi:outer membrane protein OmpA-like peptidoglycan-associated protein
MVGNRTRAKIVKNKVAPPFKEAEFDIMYGEGISKIGEIIDLGVKLELIDKTGAWFTVGDQKLQGRDAVKQYFYENKIPGVTVSDTSIGFMFDVNLRFYPDSPELLPDEKGRIELIAERLKEILEDEGYSILIEGHTADVGKPVGQLNLSIERTRTVMNALIKEGLDEKIFTYKGFGGTMPIADNDTEAGRAQNRRVRIIARPRATYIQRDWN